MLSPRLLAHICKAAQELPPSILESVVGVLRTQNHSLFSEMFKGKLLQLLPHTHWRQIVTDLLKIWQAEASNVSAEAIAVALSMAAYCEEEAQKNLSLEIVWTGPEGSSVPIRRTEQVLLQLIQQAKQELTIVSFAIYKVPEIAQALIIAIDRGVDVKIIAETPEPNQEPVPFGVKAGLGKEVADRANIYIWDRDKRPKDAEGRCGSLHIKCAICDRQHLFITSANLTGYALSINMEMGILVHSHELTNQVVNHFDQLIRQDILVKI